MNGGRDLAALLRGMDPVLHDGVFTFVTLPAEPEPSLIAKALMLFREDEGATLILPAEAAKEAGFAAEFPCRMITLRVHSALEAVGFIAAISARLTALGLGVNPVSAFYHDHLFISAERAEEALAALRELAKER